MSAANFYLEKGYTPAYKTTAINGLDTISVWTPTTSTKVVITGMTISNNPAGTIAFYFGNLAGTKFAEFVLAGSSTVSPNIGMVDVGTFDRSVFAKVSASASDGWRITLTGFELPWM